MNTIFNDIKMQYKIGGIANKMIYWNIGIFLLSIIFFYNFKTAGFNYPNWVGVSSEPLVVLYSVWTLLTYAFFHNGFFHLFFNMIVLNFSSRLFLTFFTQKQYLALYVLSAIFAGICFCACFYLMDELSLLVGASAAIMAILVATTTYQPLMEIRLLLVGTVKLWHITAVILLLDLLQLKLENTGGHIAHLSGAFFGFIFIKLLIRGIDLSKIVNSVIGFFSNLFIKNEATPFKKVHINRNKSYNPRESRIIVKDKTQQQIDEILDKISHSGYDSLTSEEKEFLFKVGK